MSRALLRRAPAPERVVFGAREKKQRGAGYGGALILFLHRRREANPERAAHKRDGAMFQRRKVVGAEMKYAQRR